MLSLNDVNHCLCPGHANYDVVANQFNDIDDDVESMETTYICSPVITIIIILFILFILGDRHASSAQSAQSQSKQLSS